MTHRLTASSLCTLGLLAILAPIGPAVASEGVPPMVFARVYDAASLDARDVVGSYDFETGTRFNPNGSTRLTSLKHRFNLSYGMTDWLAGTVEQTVKYHIGSEPSLGVFRPELRLSLAELLGWDTLPADLNSFVAGRVRFTGRRDSSLELGLGTRTRSSGWVLTANASLELTVPEGDQARNIGPRYDLGVGINLWRRLMLNVETWGHAAWDDTGYLEQEHAVGPSLFYFVGPVRVGVASSLWFRHMAGGVLGNDLRATLVLGFAA